MATRDNLERAYRAKVQMRWAIAAAVFLGGFAYFAETDPDYAAAGLGSFAALAVIGAIAAWFDRQCHLKNDLRGGKRR